MLFSFLLLYDIHYSLTFFGYSKCKALSRCLRTASHVLLSSTIMNINSYSDDPLWSKASFHYSLDSQSQSRFSVVAIHLSEVRMGGAQYPEVSVASASVVKSGWQEDMW